MWRGTYLEADSRMEEEGFVGPAVYERFYDMNIKKNVFGATSSKQNTSII